MKLTRTTRERKCHNCKRVILNGELYRKASIAIGSPDTETAERQPGGHVAYISHGIRIPVCYCAECAAKAVPQ